ncbi:hypothetical protein [Alienimonas chondri]|uniref:Holin n=1 Tax=Alienimonas chondri TaxID=2681879 RepID=A0ABX1VJ17_9PLAN|nr:hypothetical protein [Alienimonas chondri]NNJ27757.1 hypothetical protein [Alienimonas chondri]
MTTTTAPSPRYRLNAADGLKILRGAALAAGGAILAYLSTEVLPNLTTDAALGGALAAAAATTLNALRKWLTGPAV